MQANILFCGLKQVGDFGLCQPDRAVFDTKRERRNTVLGGVENDLAIRHFSALSGAAGVPAAGQGLRG